MPPHEISPVLCSMNFADNFWVCTSTLLSHVPITFPLTQSVQQGREQKGVKTLLARMRHAKETCEDVRHMYEAR
jgi:hypothetical protein